MKVGLNFAVTSVAAVLLALSAASCMEAPAPSRALETPDLLFGGYGTGQGQFKQISAAALVDSTTLVIADNELRRISWIQRVPEPRLVSVSTVYYSDDAGVPSLPAQIGRVDALASSGDTLFVASPEGIWVIQGDAAQLVSPESLPERVYSMALGSDGNLYVLGDDSVTSLTSRGTLLSHWEFPGEDSPGARKLACGPDGNLYVVSTRWRQILVFKPDGAEVRRIGRPAEGVQGFGGSPRTIGVEPSGTLYVYDNSSRAMKAIGESGVEEFTFAPRGSGPNESLTVSESLVDRDGRALVLVDPPNYRVQFFDLFGADGRAVNLVVHNPEHPATAKPDHLALTLGKNPATERTLTWRTGAMVQGSVVESVEIGRRDDPARVDWSSPSVRKHEGAATAVSSNLGPYFAHEVTVSDLKSGQRYAYRAGDGGTNWTEERYFEIPPGVDRGVRVVVLGDSRNRMDVWNRIINRSAGYLPAFIINTGDLIANGEDMNDWDMWFHEARDVLGRIPLMPCLGNHERNSPNYYYAFGLPSNTNPNLLEQAYGFDYGPAHWVVLNSEYDLEEQAEWLRQDLERTDKPWIFTFYHRPAYAGHPTRGDGNADIREAWEGIFLEYGVDIGWQGHDHYYFRSKPIRNAEVVREGEGPVYVTTGGSGAPLYPIEANQYMEVGESVDHYCVMDLTEKECKVTVFRVDGSLLDEFSLKPRPKPPR